MKSDEEAIRQGVIRLTPPIRAGLQRAENAVAGELLPYRHRKYKPLAVGSDVFPLRRVAR